MSYVQTAVVGLKTLTLLAGGLITLYAFRAYRRTDSGPLRALAIGFGVITLGSLVAGGIDQVTTLDPMLALAVESAFTLVGFLAILYSLFAS